MEQSRHRKPRFARVTEGPSLCLNERDLRVLEAAHRHRAVQPSHLHRLLQGTRQHLVRRLGRLYHAGLLDRPRFQVLLRDHIGSEMVHATTAAGVRVLATQLPDARAGRPSPLTALSLPHHLRVTDVVVAFESASLRRGLDFRHPDRWPGLPGGQVFRLQWTVRTEQRKDRLLIPDGAFSVATSDAANAHFILEVDRGTMPVTRRNPSQSSFERKVEAYQMTRRCGALWKRFQVPSFRVLVVAETKRRLAALQGATARCFKRGESGMFLFAVASEVLKSNDPLTFGWQTCSGKVVRLLD